MFTKNSRIVIGLTTYDTEYLAVSVPGLARLGAGHTLIIHNDNPATRVTRRQIRKLGYRGRLRIINSKHNLGTLHARMAILDFVHSHRIGGQWFIFVDDDDILLNLDVPDVSPNVFAIIQNMVVIRTRMIDALRVMSCPSNYTVDNENVCMVRPHVGMAGTLVRMSAIMRLRDVLHDAHTRISDVFAGISYRPPVDMVMWSGLNIVAHYDNECAVPIYMDCTNYIALDLDTSPTKYGMPLQPARNAAAQIMRVVTRCDAAIREVLTAHAAA